VALLNAPHATRWSNLGLWDEATGYPEAATALAARVADAIRLEAADRVLDVGCGHGESLGFWLRRVGVRTATGVERSPGAVHVARRRLRALGLGHATRLLAADAVALPVAPTAFDAVVALDCAYHFRSRRAFLHRASAALVPGGRLALTDLVCADGTPPPRPLRVAAALCGIPGGNLVGEAAYRAHLRAAGFHRIRTVDLTRSVLLGFAAWTRRSRGPLLRHGRVAGIGVVASGLLARAAVRRGGVRYLLVTAVRGAP
jgi:cyclopropane fatty-acyl-phospholipid synthase-like methyltransferase